MEASFQFVSQADACANPTITVRITLRQDGANATITVRITLRQKWGQPYDNSYDNLAPNMGFYLEEQIIEYLR